MHSLPSIHSFILQSPLLSSLQLHSPQHGDFNFFKYQTLFSHHISPKFRLHYKISPNSADFLSFSDLQNSVDDPVNDSTEPGSTSEGVELNPMWVASKLQSRSRLKEVRLIHALILKCIDDDSVVFCNNNLISMYLKFGKLGDARKVFDEMPERSVVSWTAMLNGYLKFGMEGEGFSLLDEFLKSEVQGNGTTFVCVLILCGKKLNYELGKQVHACVIKGRWSNVIVDSAILYFYAHCGDFRSAFQVFDRMNKRDVVAWTTMITSCSQQGYGEKAIILFLQMLMNKYFPNEHTICSVLKACGEENCLKFGRQLHGYAIKKGIKNDVYIGTALVDMYARCGEMDDSRKVFDQMKRRNMVTWTSIIAGYARNGLGYEGLNLFRAMKRRKVVANTLTIVSVLRACGSIGALLTGKEVHAQVLKNSTQDNIYVGSTLVWLYCKCGEYNLASEVLQRMPLRDVVSWTAIISGCTHLGCVSSLWKYERKEFGFMEVYDSWVCQERILP